MIKFIKLSTNMILRKKSLFNETSFPTISRMQLIIGIVLGLLYSFLFYSFLYSSREILRVLSITESYDLWILTDKEVNFYNFVFAFISLIVAQSVPISYWLDRPLIRIGKCSFRKISILNDQRGLSWYFIFWFSKLGIAFGVAFGLGFRLFYTFSLYPSYIYLFVLFILVLFLQTWNTLRLLFKRNSLKWMISLFLLECVIAFGYSRINLIDYHKVNETLLKKNICYSYHIDLPEANAFEKLDRPTQNIYMSANQLSNSEAMVVVDNKEISVRNLPQMINEYQSQLADWNRNPLVYRLFIHNTTKLKYVNQLKNELFKLGINRIAYAVTPTNAEYDKRLYQNLSFPMKLEQQQSEKMSALVIGKKFRNVIAIRQTDNGSCSINGIITESKQIKNTLQLLIKQNPDYAITYITNEDVKFANYLKVLSFTKEALNELKNEYARTHYSKGLDEVTFDEYGEILKTYPFRIVELTGGETYQKKN